MEEERRNELHPLQDLQAVRKMFRKIPERLIAVLTRVAEERGVNLYVVGGTVRDWLMGRVPGDLDLTVSQGAVTCSRALISCLRGGAFVPLGCAEEDAARVVWQGWTIDFSNFRLGARTIEEDLCRRDYTINAMGISWQLLVDEFSALSVVDPLGGLSDLQKMVLRTCPGAFQDDPLRMLRGYRLSATLGFTLGTKVQQDIADHAQLLSLVSVERVSAEMDKIMASDRAAASIEMMAGSGLLWQLLPELARGLGMEQPGYHHLDVFHHSLAALQNMEEILADPCRFYPCRAQEMEAYIVESKVRIRLKWAALLHDLGKPGTMTIRADKDGRVTFYGHDQEGKKMVLLLGRKWKWSNELRESVAGLVGMHMQPFHLCNVRRQQPLSRKACLHLVRKAGKDLSGLFLLAMADSLAGKGELKPPSMETELAELYDEVMTIEEECLRPVMTGPRLLSGWDLMERFHLQPGPLFSRILDGLQEAQVEGEVGDREAAVKWVQRFLELDEEAAAGRV